MGSKKKGISTKIPSIDDPINSDTWKCVVVMAVEKSILDSFVLRDFMEESNKGRRQLIKLINFEANVLRILNDFAMGELPYKYAFLLNFKSIFQEAAEYITNQTPIPIPLLAKVLKALLFFLRDENLALIEKKIAGTPDPIKAMAERSADPGNLENTRLRGNQFLKKEKNRLGKIDLKLRPPSMTKAETKLLKRGEGAKEDELIEDSPINGFFDLYVLLTGFYQPNLPLELIKAGIPLHGLLCIDTSLSNTKDFLFTFKDKFQSRHFSEDKFKEIYNFWNSFLKLLWDPNTSYYFKDTIFQVYAPRNLLSAKKKRKEYLYQEISYLMYDLSDLARQLQNYLTHINLRKMSSLKVEEVEEQKLLELNNLPNECVTVPVLLQYMIDAICFQEENAYLNNSVIPDATSLPSSEIVSIVSYSVEDSHSVETPSWSQLVKNSNNFGFVSIYHKMKELDAKYNLEELYCTDVLSGINNSEDVCLNLKDKDKIFGENISKALNMKDGIFGSYWTDLKKSNCHTFDTQFLRFPIDNCLYSLLFTKVVCPYGVPIKQTSPNANAFLERNSDLDLIEGLEEEMRKPHFTITEGSRSALRSIPYNIKKTAKDFFCISHLKIISPEKLKAFSAPEFHCPRRFAPNMPFISEMNLPNDFFLTLELNAFENLRDFLGENFFGNVTDFDFIEELSKEKLLAKEEQHWSKYNCSHFAHSILMDTIFVVLHNRKNKHGTEHETFNETLKTKIGLRDFFEYVLEDEFEWLKSQEEAYKNVVTISSKKNVPDDSLKKYSDSFFWLSTSIKYQTLSAKNSKLNKTKNSPDRNLKISSGKATTESSKKSSSKGSQGFSLKNEIGFKNPEVKPPFEGYDVSDMAVQFSGLKTTYFACECTVEVELTERLYGKQNLEVRITQGGHTLYFHSLVCPVPHLLEPYVFHLAFRSGIFLAFGRRFGETFYERYEDTESEFLMGKSVKNSSRSFSTEGLTKERTTSKVTEEEVSYDMALSLPNGLSVTVVRNSSKPSYIKQTHLASFGFCSEATQDELNRLILSDGTVVKMLKNGKVHFLKANSSVVTAFFKDLVIDGEIPNKDGENILPNRRTLTSYEEITSEGYAKKIERGKVVFFRKFPISQKTEIGSNTIFSYRKDGAYCMLQNEGLLSVKFKDDTKISSFPFIIDIFSGYPMNPEYAYESEEESIIEEDSESTFVFVHLEFIVEHPDYATAIYNTYSRLWKIFLPFDFSVVIEPEGYYFVKVDNQTELKVNSEVIEMNRFSESHELLCSATVDLSVFDQIKEGAIYCQVDDVSGKTFVVEPNSNCYIINDNESEQSEPSMINEGKYQVSSSEVLVSGKGQSNSSEDAVSSKGVKNFSDSPFKLSPENKYFVVRKDITGLEIFHKKNVKKILSDIEEGSLIYTKEIPGGQNLRCFVLISPAVEPKTKRSKWTVPSMIPDPKLTSASTKTVMSSTYAYPPCWTHPFPKRKRKFEIPKRLTCRVFFETKRTELSPSLGLLDTCFMEMGDEEIEIKHSKIETGVQNIRKYIKRLSDDDQEMLKEMYALVAKDLMIEKKRLKLKQYEKSQHYLRLSKYHAAQQEYLKNAIKNLEIPNYFEHPEGMSWLLVNEWFSNVELPVQEKAKSASQKQSSSSSFVPYSSFSYEEIEYDLSVATEISYSDLNYNSDISARTAPAILTGKEICRCKIKDPRTTESAPIYELRTASEHSEDIPGQKECAFLQNDFKILEGEEDQDSEILVIFKDLITLGIV